MSLLQINARDLEKDRHGRNMFRPAVGRRRSRGDGGFRACDDPHPRIAEDVRVATDAPIGLAAWLLGAVLGAVTFIGILWNVGGDLALDVAGRTLTVPKYLMIAVGLYCALLTLAISTGRQVAAS